MERWNGLPEFNSAVQWQSLYLSQSNLARESKLLTPIWDEAREFSSHFSGHLKLLET